MKLAVAEQCFRLSEALLNCLEIVLVEELQFRVGELMEAGACSNNQVYPFRTPHIGWVYHVNVLFREWTSNNLKRKSL